MDLIANYESDTDNEFNSNKKVSCLIPKVNINPDVDISNL